MGNNTTFLHYLKNLAITAALCILPASALAQEYTDLVGNTLSGWQLYWGTYRSDSHTYDWTTVQGFGANTGSGEDGITSNSGAYMPAVDEWKNHLTNTNWPSGGASVCAPRFYINSSTGTVGQTNYDPIYNTNVMGGLFNSQPACYLSVLPNDPEPYVTSMRLGSVSYSRTEYDYATELYFPRNDGGKKYIEATYRKHDDKKGKYSSAEGASYDIFVTEENAMLIINYAFVAGDPNCQGSHEHLEGSYVGACPPAFDLAVMPLVDLGTGESGYDENTRVKCGKASLTPCEISGQCQRAASGNFNGRPMVNSGWHKAVYNLRDYIGSSVRILIRTHDCVYKGNDAGGHSGYLYFTARTRPVDLKIKYCKSNEPITVTAPKGFDSYQWSGYNGTDYVSLPSYTNQRSFTVPNANSLPYSKIKCDMLVDGNECVVSVESPFLPANLKPTIVTEHRCNYNIYLKDETFKNPNIPGDDASLRLWYVLDADTYSDKDYNYIKNLDFSTLTAGVDYISIGNQVGNDVVQADVEHQFDPRGQWVRLYVENSGGCEASTFVFVKPNPVAKWGTADIAVCENTPVQLSFTKNDEYNSLSQTDAATEVFRWSQYSNLSSDLKFIVTKEDGTTVSGVTGQPLLVGDAKTNYIHFNYVVKDKWGCETEGVYDIVVNQKPFLAMDLDLIPDSTDENGTLYYKVCDGATKTVGAYSTNAKNFMWSDETANHEGELSGGIYRSSKKQYKFGNYYINITDNSENHCQNRIYFNVISYWDKVQMDVPDPVCPFQPAAIVARNFQSAPTWWEVRDGETEKINQQSGAAMSIAEPSSTSTYYCHAFDKHGCQYTLNTKLNLASIKSTAFTFQNTTKGQAVAPTQVSAHHYTLPDMCSADNLAITAVSSSASGKAKHAYKTNYMADFVEIEGDNYSITQDGFSPLENQELTITWRTIPLDVFGNEECIVYDYFTVKGYPTILSKVYVNDNPNEFFACDQSEVNLKVEPYFYGSTPGANNNDFEIQWTDPLGGYSIADLTNLTPKVTAVIGNATDAAQGKLYTYTYRLTSKEGGCFKDFEIPVYISPLPEFDLTAEPEFLCGDGREFVTATDHASGTYPVYGNPTVAKWTFPNNGDLTHSTEYTYITNRQSYTNITTEESITVTGTTAKGCQSKQTVTIKPATTPDPKVKILDVNGAIVDKVCAGSEYRLAVLDENYSSYGSTYGCNEENIVTVKRKSSPLNDIMWSTSSTAPQQLTSNGFLTHVYEYAGNGTEFGNYTARNVTQNAEDYYDIEITSPCGCKSKVEITVPIVPAPVVTITKGVNKNFMCPNEQIELTAVPADPTGVKKYYWTVSQSPIVAGDLTGAQEGTATTTADWSDNAESFYYTAQIYNGQCYGVASILLYNQEAPTFGVTAEPDAVCQNGNASVTLTAQSVDPTAQFNKYYLKNPQGNYNGVLAWDGVTKVVNNVKNALVDNKLYVRAGVARYVGANEIFTTETGRFCYSEVEVPLAINNNATIKYEIKKEANGAALAEPVSFCPDENYVFEILNSSPIPGVPDVITLTDIDDPTRTWTKTVNSGMKAVFEDARIITSGDKRQDRWKISISPLNTACSTETRVNVGINEVPVVTIDPSGARYLLGENKDTATYCVNYYSIFGSKGVIEKDDIKFTGVDLHATVLNPNGGAYQYHWDKTTSTGTSTVFWKNQAKENVSVNDATVEGFVENATKGTPHSPGTFSHDATYSVYVTDAAGCRSNTATMTVRALDAPRYNSHWQDDPSSGTASLIGSATVYNACVNSMATVRLNEGMEKVRVSEAPIPRYTYKAYYADAADPDGKYDDYGFGTALGNEITISNWAQVTTNGLGTLKNSAGVIVPDSVNKYVVRSTVQFPIGAEEDYYYVITKQNEDGCVNYQTLHYNPHQSVDPKKVQFRVSVDDGSTNVTKVTDLIKIGELQEDATVAKVCPGDKLVFDFWNETDYSSKYQNPNPWNYNHNYQVAIEFANPSQGTSTTSWATINGVVNENSPELTISTGKTISGKQRFRFVFYQNSERDSRCPTYSDYYYIDINDSPVLYGFGDNACRLNADGQTDGEIKFRVASSAPDGAKHHYEWFDQSGNTPVQNIVGYSFDIEGVDNSQKDMLSYKPGITAAEFGTALYKDYTVLVRDHVEGYCRSADLKITKRIYNNPDFTITADKDVVCSGDEIQFRVEQNYNVARGGIWQYYTNDDVINTTYTYSMYNDNANRKTGGADDKHTSNTFPHYYTVEVPVTKLDQKFKVNAFFNSGQQQTFMPNAGANVNLHCYTTKEYTVNPLQIPQPKLSLIADETVGHVTSGQVFMTSTPANPLGVENKICPDVKYHRVFENTNEEKLTGYTHTQVSYYIKSNEDDEFKELSAINANAVTENVNPLLTADSKTYMMYAKSEYGCESEMVTFSLPLGQIPTATITASQSGVCADDKNTQVSLTANARNGSDFSYEWYQNSVSALQSLTNGSSPDYREQKVNPNQNNSSNYINTSQTYWVRVTNGDGCETTASAEVESYALPQFTASLLTDNPCESSEVRVQFEKSEYENNYNNELFQYQIADGTSYNSVGSSANTPVVSAPITVHNGDELNFRAVVPVGGIYCYDTKSITVQTSSIPVPEVTILAANDAGKHVKGSTIQNGETLCPGSMYYLSFQNTAHSSSCAPDVFVLENTQTGEVKQYTAASGIISSDNFVLNDNVTYRYKVISGCNCESPYSTVNLKVSALPLINVSGPTEFCEGQTADITLSAFVNGDNTNTDWEWTPSPTADKYSSDQTFRPVQSQTYQIKATNNVGCTNVTEHTITSLAVPSLTVDPSTATVCAGDKVTLNVANTNSQASVRIYNWTGDNGTSYTEATINPTVTENTKFTVQATADNALACLSEKVDVIVKAAVKPEVAVQYYRALGGKFDPATTSLCPGEEFYIVLQNTKPNSSVCGLDHFTFWEMGSDTPYEQEVGAGQQANQNGAFKFRVGETGKAYQYKCVSSCGCESVTGTFSVAVAQVPVVSITGEKTYCDNTNPSLQLTANSAANIVEWTWSNNIDNAETDVHNKAVSVTPVPGAPQNNYSVFGVSADGCTSQTAIHTIKPIEVPSISFTAPAYVCEGSVANVKANIELPDNDAISTVVWTPKQAIQVADDEVQMNITGATTFTVQVTDINGCVVSDNTIVNKYETPNANLTITNLADGSTIANGAAVCAGTKFFPVFENTVPGVTDAYCSKDIVELTCITTGETFTIEGTANSVLNNGADKKTFEITDQPLRFRYKLHTSCGCYSEMGTFSVGLAPAPVVTIAANQTSFCANTNQQITLTAQSNEPNMTWNWTTAPTSNRTEAVQTYTPSSTGTFHVEGTSATGCKGEASITITRLERPELTLASYNDDHIATSVFCNGQRVTLEAVNMKENDAPLANVEWTSNVGHSLNGTPVTYNSNETAEFTAKASSTNGCYSDPVTITVNTAEVPVPTVNLFYANGTPMTSGMVCPGGVYYAEFTNDKNDANCATNKFTITDAADETKVYSASAPATPEAVANAGGSVFKFTMGTSAQVYYYNVVTSCGCASANQSFMVNVAPVPVVTISGASDYCNNAQGPITLTANTSSPNATYKWNSLVPQADQDKQQVTVTPVGTQTFSVQVTSADGCVSEPANHTISVKTAPIVSLTAPAEVCAGSKAEVKANIVLADGVSILNTVWSPATGITRIDDATIEAPISSSTTFKVTVNATNGCSAVSEPITVDPIKHPEPIVKLHYYGGPKNDQVFDPATTPLCKGTQYYPVFENQVSTPQCATTTYYLKQGDDVVEFEAASGNNANENAGHIYTVDGGATFFYTAKTSCGCESDNIGSYTIRVATDPVLSIVASGAGLKQGNSYCEGDDRKITLTVNSSNSTTTYKWDAPIPIAETAQSSVEVNPSAITYSVTGTTADGCTGEASFTINELKKPVVHIEGPASVCEGGSAELQAKTEDDVVRYYWNNGKTQDHITVNNIAAATTVNVTGYSAQGCASDLAEFTVKTIAKPQINFAFSGIEGTNYVCYGDLITVNASSSNGNADFTWYSDAAMTKQLEVNDIVTEITNSSITVKPSDKSTYNYYVKAVQDGCESTDNTQVMAYSLPTFALGGKTTYCEGDDLSLYIKNPDANTNYYWDGSHEPNNVDPYVINDVTSNQKPVVVVAVDQHECQTTISQPITVNKAPVITVDPTTTAVCPNESARLEASGADSYRWTEKDNNSVVLGYAPDFTTPGLTAQTTYRVVGTNTSTQCYDEAFVTVSVKKNPDLVLKTATVNGNVQVCEGAEKTLQVAGADTYEWDENVLSSNEGTAVIKTLYDKSYSVTGFIDGCHATLEIPVEVVTSPDVDLVASAAGVCRNEQVTLTAVVNGSNTPVAGMNYQWNVITDDNLPENVVAKNLTNDFTFELTVSQGLGSTSCKTTVSKKVLAYSLPVVEVVANQDRVCYNGIVNLSAKITSGTPDYTYNWKRSSDPGVQYPTEAINPSITAAAETFTLDVIDLNGCIGRGYKTVQAQEKVVISNIAPLEFCEGAERDSVRLNMAGATEYQYSAKGMEWTTQNDPIFIFANPNTYPIDVVGRVKLKGRDEWCESDKETYSTKIVTAPKVSMHIVGGNVDGVCSGSPVQLHVNSSIDPANCTFNWEGDKTNNHTPDYTEPALTEPRTFECHVIENQHQCMGIATKTIEVYEVPQVSFDVVPTPVCEGVTETLSAVATSSSTNEFSWKWTQASNPTFSATTQSIPVNLTNADEFSVTATDFSHGCASKTITTKVEVQKNPVIANTAKTNYCSGEEIRLVLTGAAEYYVDGDKIDGSETNLTLPVGTHYVNVYGRSPRANWSDVDGATQYCVSEPISIEEVITSGPVVNLLGDQTVCQGTPLELTAEVSNYANISGLKFKWSEQQDEIMDDEGNPISIPENKLITTISSPRVISVRVTDESTNCYGVAEKTYSVWDKPYASIDVPEGDNICYGELGSLKAEVSPASNSYSYRWTRYTKDAAGEYTVKDANYIETVPEIYPSIKENATYVLNVSDAHGCAADKVSQLIKMTPKPVVTIQGADKPLCQDEMLQLTLSGADVYYVNNEELAGNVYSEKMTSARTTYYNVIGYITVPNSDAVCYSDEQQIPVTITENPTLAISGSTVICEGATLSLTVSGADEYVWNNDPTQTGETLTLNPQGAVDGVYHYSVTGSLASSGCKAVKNITVNTLKSPSFVIKPSAEGVCLNEEVSLEVVPDANAVNPEKWSVLWQGGDINGSTSNPVSTLVTGGTQFSANVTNEAGCSHKEEITIRQYDIPEIVIYHSNSANSYTTEQIVVPNQQITLCENTQLKLFAMPATGSTAITSYLWDGANVSNQIYYPEDNVPNKLTYQHVVIGTSANGCKTSAVVNVAMVKAPTVAIRANMAACQGDMIQLDGTGADTYQWVDFNNNPNPSYQVQATNIGVNTFTLYGYNAQGCRGVATFDVTVYEKPQFSINADEAYVCQGDKAIVSIEPFNPDAPYSYTWSNGSNNQTITPSQRAAGTYNYEVTVTDVNTGCYLVNTVPVTFFAAPKVELIADVKTQACRGSDLELVAQGANEYYWTVGADQFGPYYNNQVFTSSPIVSQNYELTGLNTYQNPVTGEDVVCMATKTFPITVVDAPSIQILGNGTICYGEPVKLTATGIDLDEQGDVQPYYKWENMAENGAEMEDQFTANNGAAVVYTVRGVSANGCAAVKTKTVTMRPKTVIAVDAPSPVCEGAVAKATAKATDIDIASFRWSTSPNSPATEVGATIEHVINDNVTWTVTATDVNDCKVTEIVEIEVQKKLELEDVTDPDGKIYQKVNGSYTVCSGSTIALKVSGASSYVWNDNPELNNSVIMFAPENDVIYTVEGVYGVCTAKLSIPVHAIPAPAVAIEGDGAVCMGDDIKLSPWSNTDNLTYTWSAAASFVVDDATNVITLTPTVDTKVNLTGTNAQGCSGTATTNIKVNNLPQLTMEGDLAPCSNTYMDLTATGAMSYTWTVTNNGTPYTINSSTLSTMIPNWGIRVTLWGVDENNCHNEISRWINPTKRPEFTVEGDVEICLNEALQLNAINTETACTYKWNNEKEGNVYSTIFDKAGTHTIPVTATLVGKEECTTTQQVTVIVNELPELYITGNDYPCQNSTMTVTAHGADEYVWSSNPNQKCVEATDGACTYTRDVTSPAPFSVQLSGWKNGCRNDKVFTFNVHPSPLVTINADSDEACADGVVTLTATSPDATTFDWGDDGAGATITPVITATKKFEVTVIDKYGCVGKDDYTISLISSPTLKVYASEDYNADVELEDDGTGNLSVSVCSGNALTFTARGAKTWSWVDGLESSTEESFTPAGTTTSQRIQLTGYIGSCEASRVITLSILQKPDPWIAGSMNVCEGDEVNLEANGADHYEWTGVSGVSGDHNEFLNYKLLYQPVEGNLKAIAANGCYTNVPFTLTFTQAPELHVDFKNDICEGVPMEMSVIDPNDDLVYVWNDNFSGETFSYRSTTPGSEKVKVEAKYRGIGGCSTVQELDVTTHALPHIAYSADGDNVVVNEDSTISMCSGSDLVLIPLNAKHYHWTSEDLDVDDANTMVLKPTTTTVYTITGTDGYGCMGSRDIVVKTNASPVLYSTTYGVPDENGRINVSVCRGESLDLDITGADSYSWFDGTTEKNVTVSPTYSRTYAVSGLKSSTNCPASVEYNVTVNELPDITVSDEEGNTNRVSLCRDTKFTLTAGGGESYVWYDDKANVMSRKDAFSDYAGESEYYTVVGTDANKCENKTTFKVTAIEVPTISYEPLEPKVCAGSKTTIYGRSNDANSWYWKLDDEVVSEKSSLSITPTADANYTLYGRNKYGCEASIDVPLTVFSSPTIWVDGYSVTDGVNDEISVCRYQPLTLKIVGDAVRYEWPSGEESNTMEIESANMSQKYQVTGYGANNCSTTITIPVHVIPTAKITIKGDQYVCQGSSTVLEAVAEDGTYDNYVWNNNMMGETNEVYVNEDMTIIVTGENSETGCKNTASFPIKMKPLPVLGYQGETNVCKGTSTVIYATGANSYEWQDGSTGDAYVSTPETNDVYKVIGTLDGCSDELSIPITVQVAPVIWADGLKPICEGDALDLVAMGASTYEWSDGTTTAHFQAAPLDDITYTLTGTAENGCSTTIQVPVTVRRRPVVTADGATSVCLNSTTDLTAVITSENSNADGEGNKYRWYHDDELISTQGVLNYEITEDKTYFRLEGIDPAGCANSTKITVSSLPLPNLGYTGPESICSGSEGTFFATGAKEYEWINGNDVVKGNIFKASPVTDTYYKLVGISAMGCKAESDIVLVVNQLPDVTVSGNTSVCRGDALDLVGAGAESYIWSDGTTNEHFTATPVATSEYSLTGTDANGCSNTARFTITVNDLPKFQALAEYPNVCQGEKDKLWAENEDKNGEYSYFWTTADGTNLTGQQVEPVISWDDAVEFTVIAVNDLTHCQSSVKKTIYSNPIPTVGFLPYDSVCAHGSITVTAYGAQDYEWQINNKVVGNEAAITLSDLTTSTQLYVTGSLSGCSSTSVASVIVVPNPIATISEPDGKDYFCNGSTVHLVGSGLGKDGVYEWKANGEPLKVDTALYSEIEDHPARSTEYTLTVTNEHGCTNTVTKRMNIQTLPVVGINRDKSYVCPGQVDSVKFQAVNNTYNRDVQWYWESVPGQPDIQANQVEKEFMAIIDTTVRVTLKGIDELGCVGTATVDIQLRQKDPLKFRVNPSCIDDESRTVRFTGIVPEAENTKWTWTVDMNEQSTNDTQLEGAIANYTYPGILADSILVGVHAVDPYGCIYDSTAYIYKWHDFWAPDAFSPNGDGLNDRFVFRGGRFINEFHVIIYDRLGGIVYEGDENDLLRSTSDEIPSNYGWDGTCKGKACPWGVYGYTVTYSSNENSVFKSGKKRGSITLIR
ncbi:MAG: gliding motility-associated C-terminal domain-containing protein [Paludibacteraceae bacterium]|nr:gliding motility-associated C-terminal domain-containing protein [Paludibacteraceae bacterium]